MLFLEPLRVDCILRWLKLVNDRRLVNPEPPTPFPADPARFSRTTRQGAQERRASEGDYNSQLLEELNKRGGLLAHPPLHVQPPLAYSRLPIAVPESDPAYATAM